MDPNAWIDPMYTTWAAIVANAATMVGRELFADEAGYLRYRLSHFNDAPSGTIPTKRILSVSQTLDSDEGIINRVAVRYGVQTETPFRERDAQLPSTYDEAHYHTRLLVIPAPWLENNADAQRYAEWALSWAAHDTRPAVVSVAFWPTVRIGQVLTLNYPPGQPPERYYVSSVVHDVTIPGPAVTVLGLTCGRPLDEVWTAIPAPSLIPTATVAGASGRTLPSGTGWTVTYYTPCTTQDRRRWRPARTKARTAQPTSRPAAARATTRTAGCRRGRPSR